MIYWELFWGFLKVGSFAFGGAYGAIPLIREVALGYGWITDETFAYFVAVSESTPGPITVNLATYVGSDQGGLWGAFIATFAVVLPSFLLILLITVLLKAFQENRYVQALIGGIQPCMIGLVLATGLFMMFQNGFGALAALRVDARALGITALLLLFLFIYRRMRRKNPPTMAVIGLSALLGMALYSL